MGQLPPRLMQEQEAALRRRVANILRAKRGRRPLALLAWRAGSAVSRTRLRALERAEVSASAAELDVLARVYGFSLSDLAPERTALEIDAEAGRIRTAGVETRFVPEDEDSLLVEYLRLMRSLRREPHAPAIPLRRVDIEHIATYLRTDGTLVIDRLSVLMGSTVQQRRVATVAFASGATIIMLGVGAAAVTPSEGSGDDGVRSDAAAVTATEEPAEEGDPILSVPGVPADGDEAAGDVPGDAGTAVLADGAETEGDTGGAVPDSVEFDQPGAPATPDDDDELGDGAGGGPADGGPADGGPGDGGAGDGAAGAGQGVEGADEAPAGAGGDGAGGDGAGGDGAGGDGAGGDGAGGDGAGGDGAEPAPEGPDGADASGEDEATSGEVDGSAGGGEASEDAEDDVDEDAAEDDAGDDVDEDAGEGAGDDAGDDAQDGGSGGGSDEQLTDDDELGDGAGGPADGGPGDGGAGDGADPSGEDEATSDEADGSAGGGEASGDAEDGGAADAGDAADHDAEDDGNAEDGSDDDAEDEAGENTGDDVDEDAGDDAQDGGAGGGADDDLTDEGPLEALSLEVVPDGEGGLLAVIDNPNERPVEYTLRIDDSIINWSPDPVTVEPGQTTVSLPFANGQGVSYWDEGPARVALVWTGPDRNHGTSVTADWPSTGAEDVDGDEGTGDDLPLTDAFQVEDGRYVYELHNGNHDAGRQLFAGDGEPITTGSLTLHDVTFEGERGPGKGWAITYGTPDDNDRFGTGYTLQIDPGFGSGEFVIRTWDAGGSHDWRRTPQHAPFPDDFDPAQPSEVRASVGDGFISLYVDGTRHLHYEMGTSDQDDATLGEDGGVFGVRAWGDDPRVEFERPELEVGSGDEDGSSEEEDDGSDDAAAVSDGADDDPGDEASDDTADDALEDSHDEGQDEAADDGADGDPTDAGESGEDTGGVDDADEDADGADASDGDDTGGVDDADEDADGADEPDGDDDLSQP